MQTHTDILLQLHNIISSLGFRCNLLDEAQTQSTPMLAVLEDEEENNQAFLFIAILPDSTELDGSVFVQCYQQYPFTIPAQQHDTLARTLLTVNNELPVGHFSISEDNYLYFKYVLVMPQPYEIQPEYIVDVLDMCFFAFDHYYESFQAIAFAE
jgi:hypothetical protein